MWIKDLEFSKHAQCIQDKLYKYVFGTNTNINRFDTGDDNILDVKYHIDLELELQNGIKLLGQEKALRNKFDKFKTFTIEFYQNRFTKEKGEFFNLGAQFYCHGYLNGDSPKTATTFNRVYIIKIFDYLAHLKKTNINTLEQQTKSTCGSNASFFHIKYDNIPNEFIYFKHIKQLS